MSLAKRLMTAAFASAVFVAMAISVSGCGSSTAPRTPGAAPTEEERAKLEAVGKTDPSRK